MKVLGIFRTAVLVSTCSLIPALTGCAANNGGNVPSAAVLAASGNGELTATAPDDGTVYLYDKDSDRLVYSSPILKGQTFSVDKAGDRLLIDGKVVQDKTSDIDHMHRILFETSTTRQSTGY